MKDPKELLKEIHEDLDAKSVTECLTELERTTMHKIEYFFLEIDC